MYGNCQFPWWPLLSGKFLEDSLVPGAVESSGLSRLGV